MSNYYDRDGGEYAAERYMKVLKFVVMITMLGVMYVSAGFSENGFSFQLEEYAWVGWFLALVTIVVQLAWNRMEEKSLTTWLIGLVTYAYSIGTNVIGVHTAQNNSSGDINEWIFPIALGLFLDILPEPLFVWALTNGVLGSDPIGKVLDGVGVDYATRQKQTNRNNRVSNSSNTSKSAKSTTSKAPKKNDYQQKQNGSSRRKELEENRSNNQAYYQKPSRQTQGTPRKQSDFRKSPQENHQAYREPTYHPANLSGGMVDESFQSPPRWLQDEDEYTDPRMRR